MSIVKVLSRGAPIAVLAILLGLLFHPSESLGLLPPASRMVDLGVGLACAAAALLLITSLERVRAGILIGGLVGAAAGALVARLIEAAGLIPDTVAGAALSPLLSLVLLYVGAVVGARRGALFSPAILHQAFTDDEHRAAPKILDTSVIIDGRIGDIMEAGFLDGRIVVPQFVLRELQQVADSTDAQKRARGRRGLETLQAIKKISSVRVEVTATDFPEIREVDSKLIELARRTGGKIVTNDFNLNRVARVRDIPVLNINELANALRPVVLPGEGMRVFVLKEGKEPNQGIAYLDDGTMVVIEEGKSLVGRTVDIVVTSVLQTTAGKMFFGRMDATAARAERRESTP